MCYGSCEAGIGTREVAQLRCCAGAPSLQWSRHCLTLDQQNPVLEKQLPMYDWKVVYVVLAERREPAADI